MERKDSVLFRLSRRPDNRSGGEGTSHVVPGGGGVLQTRRPGWEEWREGQGRQGAEQAWEQRCKVTGLVPWARLRARRLKPSSSLAPSDN